MINYNAMTTQDLEKESKNLVSAMKKEKNLELRSNTSDEMIMHERNLSRMIDEYVCVCTLLEERK